MLQRLCQCEKEKRESWGVGGARLAVTACHQKKSQKYKIFFFNICVFLVFRTALSPCGTDDRVKLPNLTDEEVNWQGLEDLYSINESLYQCRRDFSPGPDDRANFRKDVDKMFALRRVPNRHNESRELDDSTLSELGSGVSDLLEGSGKDPASGGPVWAPWAGDVRFTATPTLSRAPVSEEELITIDNNLPGLVTIPTPQLPLRPRGDSPVLRSSLWAQLEELEGETYSGNGLTELETRHDAVLRTHNSLQGLGHSPAGEEGFRLGLVLEAGDQEEDKIFQAQGYLPVSAPKTKATATSASLPTATTIINIITTPNATINTATNTTTNTTINTTATSTITQTSSPQGSGSMRPIPLDFEGSGLPPAQPSNRTL